MWMLSLNGALEGGAIGDMARKPPLAAKSAEESFPPTQNIVATA
jgi:hypothetical protein